MKPFLKWVGGKTQIIDKVISSFPKEMNSYYEPFLGGGSVLLALLSSDIKIMGDIYASDLNPNLIGLYINVQLHVDELITEVKILSDEYLASNGTIINRKATNLVEASTSPESYYFWIRSRFNALSTEEKISVPGSAMLLFMNKTGWRGLYREGPNGINVPFGNYKNPLILDTIHIKAVSALIQNVIFTCSSFKEVIPHIKEGDFVYLDPPYVPESEKSFVAYNASGFNKEDHLLLFQICNELNNIKMVMSNADVPIVREAFSEFNICSISCKRAIHSKNPGSKTNEALISN